MTLTSIARDYLEALGQINFEQSRAQKFAFSHTKYLPKDAACIKKVDIQRWLAGLEEGLAPALSNASCCAGAAPASKQ